MITLYSHGSPNGHKISIALEELGIAYENRLVNVFAGEGQSPEFLRLNPAGKVPVIQDTEGDLVLAESNAILLYLADKAGRLIPHGGRERIRAMELLFLQASLVGPMFGQRSHFSLFAPESVPYGIRRYEEQGEGINALVDQLLRGHEYFLAEGYSVVDIAFFGWYHAAGKRFPFDSHANLKRWYETVLVRDAVQRGLVIPSPLPSLPERRHA